jgi:hypothetical protein
MHPPRPKRTIDQAAARPHVGDRLCDWLLTHCPFTSLTVLTLLVMGATLPPVPKPFLLAIPVVMADGVIFVGRRLLRLKRSPQLTA